jgi:ankyrin repeat protein
VPRVVEAYPLPALLLIDMYHGDTALRAASKSGHEKIVELLVKAGADVNAQGVEEDGGTALFAASDRGHQKIVELLVKAYIVQRLRHLLF